MTSQRRYEDLNRVLERLLDHVESIDRKVEDILDRVTDHLEDSRLDLNWHDHAYGNGNNGYEDELH
jgi:hypothetical protein